MTRSSPRKVRARNLFGAVTLFSVTLGLSLEVDLARADPQSPVLLLPDALKRLPDGGARFLSALGNHNPDQAATLVRVTSAEDARRLSLFPVTPTLAIHYADISTWSDLSKQAGVRKVGFAVPRFPLSDEAAEWLDSPGAETEYGLTGDGTIIGVIDTGIDVTHPAFRTSSGETRVLWYLVFGQSPQGLNPALEEKYGCTGADPCAVYSGADVDEMIANQTSTNLGADRSGHGTHITSLAAGSGSPYHGVAPDAALIIVGSTGNTGVVTDPHILLGTKFIFDQAADLEMPAAVNISLGSSFGAHDGSSLLEQGLVELAEGPGRAVVVASGNDGQLVTDLTDAYPEPFGVYTEVALLPGAEVRVPFLSAPTEDGSTSGGLFLWMAFDAGSKADVWFHNGQGTETEPVSPGTASGYSSTDLGDPDDYEMALLNGVTADFETDIPVGSVVFGLTGTWQSGRAFELVLKGEGTARVWISGTGEARFESNGLGPLLPRARTRGTVAVPGSAPELITVGAAVNRTEWTDYAGNTLGFSDTEAGRRADFSSAGPNLLGHLKPELAAPGAGVIGAMASAADPRSPGGNVSLFASSGRCPDDDECYVVDDLHALTSGTSMAAPFVTGAIALLMQRQPELTMKQAKALLMAGASATEGESLGSTVGAGLLHLTSSLTAQDRALLASDTALDPAGSRLVFANIYARPSPAPPLSGVVLVRDTDGLPSGDDGTDLKLHVTGPGFSEVRYAAPGLYEFTVSADEGSAGSTLTVTAELEGSVVDSVQIPVERDATLAEHGYLLVGGTCASGPAPEDSSTPRAALLFLLMAGVLRRRRAVH